MFCPRRSRPRAGPGESRLRSDRDAPRVGGGKNDSRPIARHRRRAWASAASAQRRASDAGERRRSAAGARRRLAGARVVIAPLAPAARKRFTVSRNCFRLIGLVTKASKPEVTIFCWSSGITDAETAITGDGVERASSRIRRSASMPSMSGSWMSIRIRSGRCSLARRTPSRAGRRLDRRVAVVAQDVAHELHVLLVVLDDQDRLHRSALALTSVSLRPPRATRSGRIKAKVEPRPGALSTRIVPPCSSTKRLASDRPRPVPSDLRR